MKSVLAVFNGIKFPTYVMEYALSRAKEESASLHALFLQSPEEPSAGYGFPSDLSEAETLTDSEDASQSDNRIIKGHMKLAADIAATANISFSTELKTKMTLKEMVDLTNSFDLVCLDSAYDDETPSMGRNDGFTSRELIEQATSTIKLISEDSRSNQ